MTTLTLSPWPGTQFVSDWARRIQTEIANGLGRLRDSSSLGLDSRVFEQLDDVADECRVADWDAQGAEPVLAQTLENARAFLDALPLGCQTPDVAPEADGQIAFEWYRSPRWTVSVSVSADGNLYFAALLGASRQQGCEPFLGSIPDPILKLIGRVYGK